MLGIKTYTQEYIYACRARVESDLAAYRNLVSKNDAFESAFFNNMVLLLDYLFVHRLRTVEGKDGNPMNEVRVLCNSMLNNDNVFTADNSIKLKPEKSVLKYQFGDEIKVTEEDFLRIRDAYFAEVESKFS
jgi:hypothetical protein